MAFSKFELEMAAELEQRLEEITAQLNAQAIAFMPKEEQEEEEEN